MAITEEALLERLTRLIADAGFTPATGNTFTMTPGTAIEGAFTITLDADRPMGGMNFTEECRATAVIGVARLVNNDELAARARLQADARQLINTIVRDGAEDSGEYAVEDGGRTVAIEAPAGASYLVARVRVPMNYEALIEA